MTSRASFAPAWLVLLSFAVIALGIAYFYPFPSLFDELQHYSAVRAQFDHPDLAADPRDYGVVRPEAPRVWSGQRNYVNHPALYYVLLSPLLALSDSAFVLRLANVALASGALALVLWAGWRRLPDGRARLGFAIVAASFPKAMLLAGMINNDNLAALAAALVFAGLAWPAGGAWLIALGLALAGWSKLTALIALGAVVAAFGLLGPRRERTRPARATILAGAGLGALAYALMWWRTGALVPVNAAVFTTPVEARIALTPLGFVARFLGDFAIKWPAAEGQLPVPLVGALLIAQLALAGVGAWRAPHARRLILAFLAGTAVLFATHFAFGWRAYLTMGDLTIAQSRYYAVIWPGLALGGALALTAPRVPRWATVVGIAAYLLPSVPGGLMLALLGI